MITVMNRNVLANGKADFELKCPSDVQKPTELNGFQIAENSLLVEVDTLKVFYYDGSIWVKAGS